MKAKSMRSILLSVAASEVSFFALCKPKARPLSVRFLWVTCKNIHLEAFFLIFINAFFVLETCTFNYRCWLKKDNNND